MNKSYTNKQSPGNVLEFKCQRSDLSIDFLTGKYTRSQRYKYAVLFNSESSKKIQVVQVFVYHSRKIIQYNTN